MAEEILTEDESSRISWGAWALGVAREEMLRTACQVKSLLSSRPAFVTQFKAQIGAGFDDEGKAAKALVIMVKGAMAGAAIYFASPLGVAVAAVLAEVGIVVAAGVLAVLIVVVAAMVLLSSITQLPGAIKALTQVNFNEI
jgi:hypothetical protein